MGKRGEKCVFGGIALCDLLVEPRVIHEDPEVVAELLHEFQIILAIAAIGFGILEREGAEDPAA